MNPKPQMELEFKTWEEKTLQERVLWLLSACPGPVTTTDFLNAGIYTFRNRISELRRKGYRIEAEKIEGKSIYRYRLVS